MSATTLYRPRNGRMIAGVCAGLAIRFGWDPALVRVIAVLSIFLPGPQFLAYILLWIIMPNEERRPTAY
jgi:phage shock protein PspC (stress-responsive transcriptional regulator)